MTKKPATTMKANKTSRLGHDPFTDIDTPTGVDEDDIPQSLDIDNKQCTDTKDEPVKLNLPSRFSIASVEEIYKRMSFILTQEQNRIEIDAEQTESVDTAAIQMLYAFTLQANMSGGNIHWQSHSKAIDNAARILNINILENTD